MKPIIDLQIATKADDNIPSLDDFTLWVERALVFEQEHSGQKRSEHELSIRIVENDESQQLNHQYRGKNYPTNVLSFPFEQSEWVSLPLLGDLVIAKQVIEQESLEQKISLQSHYAHLTIHGTLHLLGYDHILDDEAEIMEGLETKIMLSMGFADPYYSEKI